MRMYLGGKLFEYLIDSFKFIVFLVYSRTELGKTEGTKAVVLVRRTDHGSGLPPSPHQLQLLLEEGEGIATVPWPTCFDSNIAVVPEATCWLHSGSTSALVTAPPTSSVPIFSKLSISVHLSLETKRHQTFKSQKFHFKRRRSLKGFRRHSLQSHHMVPWV